MTSYEILIRLTLEGAKEVHVKITWKGNLAQEEICEIDVEKSNRQEDEICHHA